MSSNEVTWKDKLKAYTRTPGSLIVMLLVMISAIMTFAVLIFLIVYVLVHGVPYLKPSIFSLHYTSENASLMPALINTVIMTLLSLLIAVPFGIFAAIIGDTGNPCRCDPGDRTNRRRDSSTDLYSRYCCEGAGECIEFRKNPGSAHV